jgi:hypothetical protein
MFLSKQTAELAYEDIEALISSVDKAYLSVCNDARIRMVRDCVLPIGRH